MLSRMSIGGVVFAAGRESPNLGIYARKMRPKCSFEVEFVPEAWKKTAIITENSEKTGRILREKEIFAAAQF